MLDLLFAIALPAIASATAVQCGRFLRARMSLPSLWKSIPTIHNVAVALFLTDLFMVIAACLCSTCTPPSIPSWV